MKMEQLLELSVKEGASDLHVVPDVAPLLRIDGILAPATSLPVFTAKETKQLLNSIMTEEQKRLFEKNRVIEMALSYPDIGNFRASIFHQYHGIGGVFRIVPSTIPVFDSLLLPPVLKTLLNLSFGLILVVGTTGSGKSTSLAAMVDYINRTRTCNIVTIEDPIEFIHKNKKSVLNQFQVGRDVIDFPTALRSCLRQDPDVILIGELRDLETMRLALTAAETGHLVLATLHASSAPLAISRFVDVFPNDERNKVRTLLSEALQGVICQTLVKKTGGGRIAAFELMLMTIAIRHYIRQDMPAHMESTIQTSLDKGMFSLEQALQQLVNLRLINTVTASQATLSRSVIAETERMTQKLRKKPL